MRDRLRPNRIEELYHQAPSFARFLDFPLELRDRVYEIYFQIHGSERLSPFKLPPIHGDRLEEKYYYKSVPPHEPAVTHVSRQLRSESLKIFYSTYRFPLVIHLELLSPFRVVDWYHSLSPDHVKAIGHMELHFCFEKFAKKYSGIRAADGFFIDIDLDRRLGSYSLEMRVPEGCGPLARAFSQPRLAIRKHVRRTLDEMMVDPGVGNFTAADWDGLVPD